MNEILPSKCVPRYNKHVGQEKGGEEGQKKTTQSVDLQVVASAGEARHDTKMYANDNQPPSGFMSLFFLIVLTKTFTNGKRRYASLTNEKGLPTD